MDSLINLTILILVITEYFSFFYTILRERLRKFSRKQLIWGGVFMVCLTGLTFGAYTLTPLYFTGIFFAVFILYLLFENSFFNILKLCMVAFPALSLLESIIMYLFETTADMGERGNAVLCMVCIVAVLWFYYALLGRRLDKDAFHMPEYVWLIVVGVMFLSLGLISYFTYVLSKIIPSLQKNIGLLLITAGGLTIFMLIFAMIYYFNTKQKYRTEKDFLEQYNEQQKQYFEDLLRKEQDTRQFRHDITAHLLQIQNFCQKGEREAEERYITELLDEITRINRKGYRVGNDIIDTILNTYLAPVAPSCTVKVKGYMDQEIAISKRDLCVIVFNLVKNAVEAVEQSTYEDKEIVFEVNQGKQFLSIKVKNTADIEKISIQNQYPVTGKENKRMHGLGIRNVQAVAEKYGGSYQYQIENVFFIAEVQLQI